LLEAVYGLEEIRALGPDPFLGRIKFSLMDAGEKVYKTTSMLVEQLRKYLDDQSYLENRRIMEIIKGIEKLGVLLKDDPPGTREFAPLDDVRPGLELVMARGLFTPTAGMSIRDSHIGEGIANPDIDVEALYRQNVVNEAELRRSIEIALQSRSQITLAQLYESKNCATTSTI